MTTYEIELELPLTHELTGLAVTVLVQRFKQEDPPDEPLAEFAYDRVVYSFESNPGFSIETDRIDDVCFRFHSDWVIGGKHNETDPVVFLLVKFAMAVSYAFQEIGYRTSNELVEEFIALHESVQQRWEDLIRRKKGYGTNYL